MSCGTLPVPVNLEAYKSIDKIEAKKALNFSEDDFVVGFCGPNKSSSLIPNLIEAFTQFVLWNASHKKNLVLLIATDNYRSLWDIERHIRPEVKSNIRVNKGSLLDPRLLQCMDLYYECSSSSLSGQNMIHAAACKVPVMAPYHTAMADMCDYYGASLVDSTKMYDPDTQTQKVIPITQNAADIMYNFFQVFKKHGTTYMSQTKKAYEKVVAEHDPPDRDWETNYT